MKVLIWTHRFPPDIGGVQSVVHDLGICLARHKYEVHVLTSLLQPRDPMQEHHAGMVVRRLPFIPWVGAARPDSAPLTALFERCIRGISPDLVHLHYAGVLSPYVLTCIARLRLPFVVTVHGADIQELSTHDPAHQQMVRDLLAHADAVIAVSQALLSETASVVPEIRDRLECIVNGVCPVSWADSCLLPDQSPANPFASLRPYILAAGRFVAKKRFDLLLEAFAGLDGEQWRRYRLLILGTGPLENALHRRARELGVTERVVFGGPTSRELVLTAMSDAEALVLSSAREPLGMVLLEAMMVGCPVVATCVDGVPEVVEHRRTGILVAPGAASSLRDGIEAILADRQLRIAMVRAARESVVENHTIEAMTERYERVYKRCVGEAAPAERARPMAGPD